MNRRKIISITLVGVLLAGLGTAGFTGTVAAQSDSCNPIFEDCDISTWDAASAFVSGLSERISYNASQAIDPLDGSIDGDTAQSEADAVQKYVNDNSTSFVDYYNSNVTQELYTDQLIVRLTFEMNDESVDKYLYADFASDGTLNSISVQDSLNSGDSAEEYVVLEDIAADQALSVIEDFDNEFVEDNESVSHGWQTKNYTKYAGHIDQSFNLQ